MRFTKEFVIVLSAVVLMTLTMFIFNFYYGAIYLAGVVSGMFYMDIFTKNELKQGRKR